ncbi:MAG: aminoglycoside phosphotransferase family protein [Anditalea sp.]
MTDPVIDNTFLNLLRKDGIIGRKTPQIHMLTGGVSSEIFRIDADGRTVVVKRALKKLKVKADWSADVSRNGYEAAFLRYVAAFLPDSVPRVLGQGEDYFVMEFLDGFRDWKSMLKSKTINPDHAIEAGTLVGKIHAHSFGDPIAVQQFDATVNFVQLRVSPYLHHMAERHPAVADLIHEEAGRLTQHRECLIHGDFSPKNILIASDRLVLVDCEVAFYGDPAFDLSFLLCHLLLKELLHAPEQAGLIILADAFMTAYKDHRTLSTVAFSELEKRVARLLPMLLLARVDGKSPVEYLNIEKQAYTRKFAINYIREENFDLKSLMAEWFGTLEKK